MLVFKSPGLLNFRMKSKISIKKSRRLLILITMGWPPAQPMVWALHMYTTLREGFCRGGNAEFRQFLKISKGSAGEVKNMYYLAEDQYFVTRETALARRNKIQQLLNGISSFIKYLRSCN